MKLFTAGLLTESNDLVPVPLTLQDWVIARPEEQSISATVHNAILALWSDMGKARDWKVVQSICASAYPVGGRMVRSAYEHLRTIILDDLKKAMPVDVVLLQLHGAAMAHGYDDCEGDLLEHIRVITGPDIPIGVELDPHCHMTNKMMDHATALILYKTVPHIDIEERAVELFEVIEDTLEDRIRPVMALYDCRMMNTTGFFETEEPMKTLYEEICEKERLNSVVSISPVHGFPMADIPDMGCKMLVITDNDKGLAQSLAEDFGKRFIGVGHQLPQETDTDLILNRFEKRAISGEKGIQFAELGDLSGCGFPTDGTEYLQAMLKRGMTNMVAGFICDPIAVAICLSVEPGTELMMRIGGKTSPMSGTPLDLKVVVKCAFKNIEVIGAWDMICECDAAVVVSGDTEILLSSRRIEGDGLRSLRQLGVEPNDKQYVLFKYGASDAELVGGSNYDYRKWRLSRVSRPKWPWDDNCFVDEQ